MQGGARGVPRVQGAVQEVDQSRVNLAAEP